MKYLDPAYHSMFCGYLQDAEADFKKSPQLAYAKLRKLRKENANQVAIDAYDTAAEDFGNKAFSWQR